MKSSIFPLSRGDKIALPILIAFVALMVVAGVQSYYDRLISDAHSDGYNSGVKDAKRSAPEVSAYTFDEVSHSVSAVIYPKLSCREEDATFGLIVKASEARQKLYVIDVPGLARGCGFITEAGLMYQLQWHGNQRFDDIIHIPSDRFSVKAGNLL